MALDQNPGGGSGGNKMVVILLIGGIVVLGAAGIIFWMRKSDPKELDEKKDPVVEKYVPPAPLVIEDEHRPIEAKEKDAGTAIITEADIPKPTKKRPKGSGGPQEKLGKIDPRQVKVFINSRFSQVRACYERQLKKNPLLEGTLDLRIGISSKGKVTNIGVNSDSVGDKTMLKCVKSTIRKWKFPEPDGGRAVFDKPFKFKKKL